MTDEIPPEKLRALFDLFLEHMRKVETELAAHQLVLTALKTEYSDIEDTVDMARKNPAIAEKMDKKYAALRQRFQSQLGSMRSVYEFLEKWTPEGPVN
jgi:uncharacterized protein (DUF3084 family)